MKYSEVKRKLQKAGCYCEREGANHEIWYSPLTGREFPVSRHNSEEAKTGTIKSITKQSGVKL